MYSQWAISHLLQSRFIGALAGFLGCYWSDPSEYGSDERISNHNKTHKHLIYVMYIRGAVDAL